MQAMADPLGEATTLPIWARVIAVLGFPTVVACLLLAVFLGWIRSPITEVLSLQQQQILLMTQNLDASRQALNEERRMIEYQNVLLRTLCYSFAKNTLQCEPTIWDRDAK